MRDVTEKVLRLITYSQELGLDLKTEEDRFKWFLASILFAILVESTFPAGILAVECMATT